MSEVRVRYHITSKVLKVFEENGQWYVHFDGSWESLGLGIEQPDMKEGDTVHITIERVP